MSTLERPPMETYEQCGGGSSKSTSKSKSNNSSSTPKTADDLDFIAAEIILSMNAAYLEMSVRGEDPSSRKNLINEVKRVIERESAAAKETLIAEETGSSEAARDVVATFYLNIAKVLSAISLAIEPENETYGPSGPTDPTGATDMTTITPIPQFKTSRLSFCGSRIRRFAKEEGEESNADTKDTSDIVAEMNTLDDYFGIPELQDMYFDTDYDMETGAFLGMTPETKIVFEHDLALFYNIFSDGEPVPDNIKRFGDIPLRAPNANTSPGVKPRTRPLFICRVVEGEEEGEEGDVKCMPISDTDENMDKQPTQPITLKAELITRFAEHLQSMIGSVTIKRRMLVDMVNKMFIYDTIKTGTKRERRPRVHPDLTVKDLATITADARRIISDMSLLCEIDNNTGDYLYNAIHELQVLESGKNQIKDMEKMRDTILYG